MAKFGILREIWKWLQDQSHCTLSEMQKKRRVIAAKQQDLQRKQDLLFVDAKNVLKTNAECETKLLEMDKVCVGIDEACTLFGTLEVVMLEDFAKCKAVLLSAFIAACEFEDATKKWKVPNKGTVSDVNEGKKCKKMGQTLLLKWACDKHLSPVTAKIPNQVLFWIAKDEPSAAFDCSFVSNEGLTDFSATVEWCGDTYLAIESIENRGTIILIVILVTWWDSKTLVA
jgi:hypothetical protein